MPTVSARIRIEAPAQDVWLTARDFGGIAKWITDVAKVTVEGSGVGAVRTIVQTDGTHVVEKLQEVDDAKRTIRYSIVESDLPFDNYSSALRVKHLGEGRCEVLWNSQLTPRGVSAQQAGKMLRQYYQKHLRGLRDLVIQSRKKGVFVATVRLRAKKGLDEQLRQVLAKLVPASRAEEGCLAYNMHQSADDPRQFMLYMKWRDVDAFDHHVQNPLVIKFDAELGGELLEGPYVMSHWVEVG